MVKSRSFMNKTRERHVYVPGTVTVLEARPLVLLLTYHELQGFFFLFCTHEWSWGPPNVMRLAMSFVSCPSQVTLVINELVFFIITCSEHHSSKCKDRRYPHVYAIETLPVFIHANTNYTLHSYFLHKGDMNYIFLEILLHQYSCTGAWNGAYNCVVLLLLFRFV